MLRPGGLFAFSHSTPLALLCFDTVEETLGTEFRRDLFGMHRIDWLDDEPVEFNLPMGEWIALFRGSGFVLEDLVEVQPPEGAESTYRSAAETAWARRWPMEQIWKLRRA